MKCFTMLAGATALAAAIPVTASAVTIIPGQCSSVADPAGCLYSGNMGNQSDADAAESQYNALRDPDINLTLLTNSDDGDFVDFGTISLSDSSQTSGTWSLPGYLVEFLGVKAGPEFILYQLTFPASSGSWSTAGLANGRGELRQLSHISFFGGTASAVPEPAAWMMLIGGFGLAGGTLRSRRARMWGATASNLQPSNPR